MGSDILSVALIRMLSVKENMLEGGLEKKKQRGVRTSNNWANDKCQKDNKHGEVKDGESDNSLSSKLGLFS